MHSFTTVFDVFIIRTCSYVSSGISMGFLPTASLVKNIFGKAESCYFFNRELHISN